MVLLVQKYGGTSVATIENIALVADRVIATRQAGHDVIVVLSAMSGETDRLVNLAKQVTEDPGLREYDALISTGELITITLLSMMLVKKGYAACSFTGRQAGILTDGLHKKGHIIGIDKTPLLTALDQQKIPVVAGFQGVDEVGDIVTLGRGGSDATAVAIAAALLAEECQIFTDVDGVYAADPRIVPHARRLEEVSYDEMLQMASLGAKVLQTQSVELSCQNDVPLRVASTFIAAWQGTKLCHHVQRLKAAPVTGVVSKRDLARLTLHRVPHDAGFVSEVLGVLASRYIQVEMLVQHHHEDEQAALSMVVPRDEFVLAKMLLSGFLEAQKLPSLLGGQGVAQLSLVGHGLNSHPTVMTTMFHVLAENKIDIFMLTCSEIKISVIVSEELLEIGVEALHNAFALSQEQQHAQG